MSGQRRDKRLQFCLIAILACAISVTHNLPVANAAEATEPDTKSVVSPAYAKQKQVVLDGLFAKLKSAPDARAGQNLTRLIWRTWQRSGNRNVDALMNQARLALREGGVEEAFGALNRVVELAPDYAEGWNRRATLNFMVGRFEASVSDIQKTLELEPRHFGALSGLSQILAGSGRWKSALEAYEKAIAVNPFLPNKDAVLKQLRAKALGQRL